MGDVYRARDTRLERDVALKVLPGALATDADRIDRFRREARLLASLNHPRIASIYGFEESEGIHALVLELVEGPTLAERLAQAPLPLDEALSIARQIAEAIEAAHEHGVVHRDLKPANIKLRPDGTVKVLDFGLASAMKRGAAAPFPPSIALVPATPCETGMGAILGTPSYMSPEQARGKGAGKRGDIWAFGCVLYEMLTGRRAFEGDSTAEVLARIDGREPDFGLLPAATPVPIRRLLRRCLEKDGQKRLPDIGVARIEIDDALAVPTADDAARATAPSRGRAASAWIVAAALIVVSVIGALVYGRSRPAESRPVVRASIPLVDSLDFGVQQPSFAVSPDGTRVVYRAVGGGPLRSRMLHEAASSPIVGTEGGLVPFFSPDGKWLAFFAGNVLKKVSLVSGAVVTIAELPSYVGPQGYRGASWGDDGTIAFSSATGQASSGSASEEARPDR